MYTMTYTVTLQDVSSVELWLRFEQESNYFMPSMYICNSYNINIKRCVCTLLASHNENLTNAYFASTFHNYSAVNFLLLADGTFHNLILPWNDGNLKFVVAIGSIYIHLSRNAVWNSLEEATPVIIAHGSKEKTLVCGVIRCTFQQEGICGMVQ